MSTQDPTPPTSDGPYGQPPAAPQYGDPAAYGGQPSSAGGASPYSGGGYGGGDAPAPRNGIGLAALIVGIVSLLAGIIPFVGFIGIAAVVLGIIGLSRVRKRIATNRGMALAGVILGALAIIAAILWVIATVFFAQRFAPALEECSSLDPSSVEYQQCVVDNSGLEQ